MFCFPQILPQIEILLSAVLPKCEPKLLTVTAVVQTIAHENRNKKSICWLALNNIYSTGRYKYWS